jgi:chromosome segregation ATPase
MGEAIKDEGHPSFRIRERRTTAPRRQKSNGRVRRKLSNQLQDVIRQLNRTEARVRHFSQELGISPEFLQVILSPHKEVDKDREERASLVIQANDRRFLVRLRYSSNCEKEQAPHVEKQEPSKEDNILLELRRRVADIHRRLDTIEQETQHEIEELKVDFEEQKLQVRQEIERRMEEQTLRRKSISPDRKAIIEYLKESNTQLRATRDELQRDIDDLKAANEALERESVVIAKYYSTLETMTENLEKDYAALLKTEASCRNQLKPMWREAILETKVFGESEKKQKTLYRTCLNRVSAQIIKDAVEPELKDVISSLVYNCEFDLKLESEDYYSIDSDTNKTDPEPDDDESDYEYASDSNSEFDYITLSDNGSHFDIETDDEGYI